MGFIAFFIAVIFVLSGLISTGYQVNIFNVQKDPNAIYFDILYDNRLDIPLP